MVRLKKKLMLWAFLFFGLLPSYCQISLAENLRPILKIEEFAHHADNYWQGQIALHSFKVNNTGNAELRIISVTPD